MLTGLHRSWVYKKCYESGMSVKMKPLLLSVLVIPLVFFVSLRDVSCDFFPFQMNRFIPCKYSNFKKCWKIYKIWTLEWMSFKDDVPKCYLFLLCNLVVEGMQRLCQWCLLNERSARNFMDINIKMNEMLNFWG